MEFWCKVWGFVRLHHPDFESAHYATSQVANLQLGRQWNAKLPSGVKIFRQVNQCLLRLHAADETVVEQRTLSNGQQTLEWKVSSSSREAPEISFGALMFEMLPFQTNNNNNLCWKYNKMSIFGEWKLINLLIVIQRHIFIYYYFFFVNSWLASWIKLWKQTSLVYFLLI